MTDPARDLGPTIAAMAGKGSGDFDDLLAIAAQLRSIATHLETRVASIDNAEASIEERTLKELAPSDRPALENYKIASGLAARARQIYEWRRTRAHIFESDLLFGEPAWDILLDLFIASSEGKTVSVSSACIASGVPSTTGLRWLGLLADHGLIVREHDRADQRRILVRLSEKGLNAMKKFLSDPQGVY